MEDDLAEEFQRHRPRLLGVAYRLLGSAWDAEDVVEEAALRWLRADRSAVREPVAFLTTMVTRLALDQLKSARARRESYYGPWLPEPVLTGGGQLGPLETVEQRESVSIATLRLLERLTPPERAVFVLRKAFDVPYEEIAETLGLSPDNARQLLHRAQTRVTGGERRFEVDAARHAELFQRFIDATAGGDLAGLTDLLAEDVVVYTDGGGKVRAAVRPLHGRDQVVRFGAGLLDKYPMKTSVRMVEANGGPAAIFSLDGLEQLVFVEAAGGKIGGIYAVMNPDKLSYLHQQA